MESVCACFCVYLCGNEVMEAMRVSQVFGVDDPLPNLTVWTLTHTEQTVTGPGASLQGGFKTNKHEQNDKITK